MNNFSIESSRHRSDQSNVGVQYPSQLVEEYSYTNNHTHIHHRHTHLIIIIHCNDVCKSETFSNLPISLSSSGMLSPSLSTTPATPQGAPSVSTTSSPQKDSPLPSATAPQPSTARRLPSSPQAIMPLPCKKVDVLQYNNFKCPECQAQFGGKAELVAHFQQIRATPNSVSDL